MQSKNSAFARRFITATPQPLHMDNEGGINEFLACDALGVRDVCGLIIRPASSSLQPDQVFASVHQHFQFA
jgi:hypothetical protein